MCGILGLFGADSLSGWEVQPALDGLHHRGPDASGTWSDAATGVWLGHRRLSIIDLSERGRQPMANEDGTVHLVCNGEIYNFRELRRELEGLGHRFYSDCDSEVILHAYESWGDACVERLEGMFAFILWDSGRRTMLAARDSVGIKPLYVGRRGEALALGSEAGAVLQALDLPRTPSPLAVGYVLGLGYVPSPHSIWAGVEKLEAGHLMVWRPGEVARVRRYWEPPRTMAAGAAGAGEFAERFLAVLREHLIADVPLGLFLSGGLDSTSVAVGLHEIDHPLQAFTVSFPTSPEDEAGIAGETARYLGLPHRSIPLTLGDLDGLIDAVVGRYDEPQGYSALLSEYLLCREVAKEFKAAVAGDGGDEAFGGYTWYRDLDDGGRGMMRGALDRLRRWRLTQRAPGAARELAKVEAFTRRSPLHRHAWRLFPRFLPAEIAALLSPTGVRFDEQTLLAPMEKHFVSGLPLKRALQRVDLMTFCTDSILAKVDRASMAHSLEVRVPFLDRRLLDWSLRLPVDPRESTESKPVLADYLKGRVPPNLLERPKQGFSLRVLENFDWDAAVEEIGRSWWVREGFVDRRALRALEPSGRRNAGQVWTWLLLSRWMEQQATRP